MSNASGENPVTGAKKHYVPPPSRQSFSKWPHRPAYFCAHPQVRTKQYKPGEPLPLGIPIDFESDLFEGKIFCRLRPIDSHPDDKHHVAYFDGKKRLYQVIFQGRFKEELRLSDIMIGDFYEKRFNGVPNGYVMKLYEKFMQSISPGIIMDMSSEKPKILTAFGSCQIMRVDRPGQEPEITGIPGNVQEDTSLLLGDGKAFSSSKQRRKYLSKPKNSSKYKVSTDHIYTFEMFDHTMCFGSYHQHVFAGTYKVDMASSMNGQPLAFGIFTRDERVICKFPVWHERLLEEMEKQK